MQSSPNDKEEIKAKHNLLIEFKRTHNVKKKRKIQRQLERCPADIIRIGNQYRIERDPDLERILNTSKKSPHLRRGHFRVQRYGKGRVLMKTIFIPPTFVGNEKKSLQHQKIKIQ